MMDDGSFLAHVSIVEMWGGTDYGEWSHPQYIPQSPESPEAPTENFDNVPGLLDDASFLPSLRRDTYALIAFVEGHASIPICLGFYYPEVSQMMFDGLQRLTRHVGDTFSAVSNVGNHYISFDKDGSAISFNNGFFKPPIVQQTDFDVLSAPRKGAYNITLYVAATQSRVHLDGTTGDIICETITGGAITINSHTDITISGQGTVAISGNPLTLSGLQGIYFG
jgi:hypothetical protein